MTRFQRRARLLLAIFVVGFSVALGLAFKRRAAPPAPAPVARIDPAAVLESTSGRVVKVNRSREDVSIQYEKQLTYKDGATKLQGVTIVTTDRNNGRTFTVTGKEGSVGQNESEMVLDGDVHLVASDGLSAKTEHATYTDSDGIVRAPGPVEFTRNRLGGSGLGMTYDKNQDVLIILDQAKMRMAARADGTGVTDIAAPTATVARRDKQLRFDRGMKALRGGQIIQSDSAIAHLTEDEERLESVELRGNSSVTASDRAPGALQALTGRDMDLKYGPDGEAIEHAVIAGDAVLQLAGQKGAPGRQIAANVLDITLAPDGATPVGLVGRDQVALTFPAEPGTGARTIKSVNIESKGDPKLGLTSALFTGVSGPQCANWRSNPPAECDVDYREQNGQALRRAKANKLVVSMKPGMSAIDDATFSDNVRFQEGLLGAQAAHATYVLDTGRLEFTGVEAASPRPHIENEQIVIDAARLDVTLEGPKMKAAGTVSSVVKPAKNNDPKSTTKMPSMLKSDQVVYISADDLNYDGEASTAAYKGGVKLWQTDTSIQAQALELDNKKGDLTASGKVTTSTMLEQHEDDKEHEGDKERAPEKDKPRAGEKDKPRASEKDKAAAPEKKKSERVRSVGTSDDFHYEESERRATYTGDAHLSGPQGDMTALKIELYLKPSGDEVDRAEAYDKLTLREQSRKTTGSRLTYTTADESYLITGLPVTIVDQCGRETKGRKLTFAKATDTVVVDGQGQVRTQTKSAGKCP
jgi:LPS export ABC transporter protein LptC